MTRPLRPVVPRGLRGARRDARTRAEVSGLVWAIGALLGTLGIAFLLKGLGGTQGSSTVVGRRRRCSARCGSASGSACVLLLRDTPEYGFVVALAVLLAVFADDTAAYFVGRLLGRHKLAPAISPGKTWEGFSSAPAPQCSSVFVALLRGPRGVPHDRRVAPARCRGRAGRAARRPLRVDAQARSGREGLRDGCWRSRGVLDRIDAILFAFPAAYFVVAAL